MIEDFPLWEPCHRALLGQGIMGFENVGGDIDDVNGQRVTFAAFRGAGSGATVASCAWWRWSILRGPFVWSKDRGSRERHTICRTASKYEAPKHHGCLGVRLQGAEVSDVTSFWLGVSTFEPGGGAEWDTTPAEKVYLVLEGEVTS